MKNQALALSLTTAVALAMGDIKVSEQLAARTKLMMDAVAPYINDDLVVEEVVQGVIERFTNDPTAIMKDGVLRDGVLYSEIEDPEGTTTAYVIDSLKEWMDMTGPEGAATVAAITTITGEEMFRHLV